MFPAVTFSLERSVKEGIMVWKLLNLINAKWKEMYYYAMFIFNSTIQATLLDANTFEIVFLS